MTKAAIYARVSTDRQVEEQTVASQLAELRQACAGLRLVGEYVDEGWSGEVIARPQLDNLRNDAAQGLFQAVYFHSPDRLSRKFSHQAIVLEELKKAGVQVVFLNTPPGDDPESRLLLGVQGLLAEYEKDKILERTRRGRVFKARTKGIVGCHPPLGYNYIKKTLQQEGRYEVNPERAELVRLIFDLYLQHRSLGRVVRELSARGVRPPRRSRWSRATLHNVLKNSSYIGQGYYGKLKSVEVDTGKRYTRLLKAGKVRRDPSEWIPIKFPPIIDPERFRLVQEVLAQRYKPREASRYFYLLTGLLRCAGCGSTMSVDSYKNRFFYYRCSNRHRNFPLPRTCHAPMVRREALDDAVWRAVQGAVTNPHLLRSHVAELTRKLDLDRPRLERQQAWLAGRLTEMEDRKERLLDLYAEGRFPKELLLRKTKLVDRQRETLEAEAIEHQRLLSSSVSPRRLWENLDIFCRMAASRVDQLEPQEKRRFLQHLVEEVRVDTIGNLATVMAHIPDSPTETEPVRWTGGRPGPSSGLLSSRSRCAGQSPRLDFILEVEVANP